MAARAIAAKTPAMGVIDAVTCHTGSVSFARRLRMTLLAAQIPMASIQRKVRLSVVIEGPVIPAPRVVAIVAAGTEISIMHIIAAVAFVATLRCGPELVVNMTFGTGHNRMQTNQRKHAHIVVETQLRTPAFLAMAALTVFPKRAAVDIGGLMTIHAHLPAAG